MVAPVPELLLTVDRVVTAVGDWSPGWVLLRGELVEAVGGGTPPSAAAVEALAGTLVPGFVDVHCHGGGGSDVSKGPTAARAVLEAHRRRGTTTTVASLVTAPFGDLVRQLSDLAPLVAAGELAGVHLEGPWLQPARRGAHPEEHLRQPAVGDAQRLLAAADGALRMVTVAPELPGALEVVDELVRAGVTVAVGHTDATYEQTREAIARGASWATHLGNAMPPLHHRQPGPALALLEDPGVTVELIVDGHHVHPAVVRQVMAAAPGRVVVVTDAMSAAGTGSADADTTADKGPFLLAGQQVTVAAGAARLVDGTLAGSTLTSDAAVRTAVAAGVPLVTAVRAASSTPARRLGLDEVGDLAPGRRADMVLLDEGLEVAAVWRGGRRLQTRG